MILAIVLGVFAGISTIYVFNRIPAKWLCDYDEEPTSAMWDVRLKQKPWGILFVAFFTICSIRLFVQSPMYGVAGLAALWILVQIAIADKKYMIIPDQLVIALTAVGFGFIPFSGPLKSQFLGALIGGGIFLVIGIFGRIIFRKEALGLGDVKLFASVGLICGMTGTIVVFFLTIFSSALFFGIGVATKKWRVDSVQPLGPFIAGTTGVFLLFRPELMWLAILYLRL